MDTAKKRGNTSTCTLLEKRKHKQMHTARKEETQVYAPWQKKGNFEGLV